MQEIGCEETDAGAGIRKLRFATKEEVLEMTGLAPGSLPPFGSLFGLPTLCDKRLGRGVNVLGYDPIWKDRQKGRFQERYFRLIKEADQAPRQRLNLHDQYYCAPQVFYFRPQKLWYLIYQIADKNHQPPFGPAYSTTTTLGDPKSWSKPRWLFPEGSEKRKWLDFWVICDQANAHLFYTSLDGRMWRAETKLADFPSGWSQPVVALQADIFEASHTYRLKGMDKYLTIVEAPADVRFLFQGASDPEYRGNPYGKIPWRLGILEMAK